MEMDGMPIKVIPVSLQKNDAPRFINWGHRVFCSALLSEEFVDHRVLVGFAGPKHG